MRPLIILLLSALTCFGQNSVMWRPWNANAATATISGCALTNGTLAVWHMDETITGGSRLDSSGNGETLTDLDSNVGYSVGVDGYQTVFGRGTGASGTVLRRADDAGISITNGSFTIKAWVTPSALDDFDIVIDKGAFDGTHDDYLLYYVSADSAYDFIVGNGTTFATCKATAFGVPSLFVPHMIVAVYNSTNQTLRLSVDEVTNIVNWTGGVQRTANPVAIGNAPSTVTHGFSGAIDEVVLIRGIAWDDATIHTVRTQELLGRAWPDWCGTDTRRNTLVFDGNSITAGTFVTNSVHPNGGWGINEFCATNVWFTNLFNPRYVNQGHAGDRSTTITNRLTNVLPYIGAGTNVYLFAEGGINDLNNTTWPGSGYTVASFTQLWTNYYAGGTAAGIRVVPNTVIDQVGLTNESQRLQFNTNILTSFALYYTNLDNSTWQTVTNSTLYNADGTHPNVNGMVTWAQFINGVMTNRNPSGL